MTRTALTFLLIAGPAAAADRPNVLVILTDDMRWDTLGVVQKEQGKAALFVKHISGSHSGVVGLPVYETSDLLARFGCKVL